MPQRPSRLTRRAAIRRAVQLGAGVWAATALEQQDAAAHAVGAPPTRTAPGEPLVTRGASPGTLIPLPEPRREGGRPLMQAIALRRTTRTFADAPVSEQQLSNLLWAAFGANRADGGRTAPSAWNWQEIDVYVATSSGAYVYQAAGHTLRQILAEDVRAETGVFPFVRAAAVTLVYVADQSKLKGSPEPPQKRRLFHAADAAFISQNVYLYCASEGLATVVFAGIEKRPLARTLELGRHQEIILAQSVGHPRVE